MHIYPRQSRSTGGGGINSRLQRYHSLRAKAKAAQKAKNQTQAKKPAAKKAEPVMKHM